MLNNLSKLYSSTPQEMKDIPQQPISLKSDYSSLDSNKLEETPILEEIIFMEDNVIYEIDTIHTTSTAGPDGLPAIFFKMWKSSLTKGTNPTFSKQIKSPQSSNQVTKEQLKIYIPNIQIRE